MKQLSNNYRKNGYEFNIVQRNGDVAIYSQHSQETGQIIYYETFIVQKNKERTIAGKLIPSSESSPSNEQWGSEGYTTTNLESALLKAITLGQTVDRRKNSHTHH